MRRFPLPPLRVQQIGTDDAVDPAEVAADAENLRTTLSRVARRYEPR